MSKQRSQAPGPGRPRSEEAHQAIIEATLELLEEVGYTGLTIEGVASRAGVGKATIYRRWPSKIPLLAAALHELPPLPSPDTGSLEGDLYGLLCGFVEIVQSRRRDSAPASSPVLPRVLPMLAAEAERSPELAATLQQFVSDRRKAVTRILERSIARGELPRGRDLDLDVDLLLGPVVNRMFFTARPVDPGTIKLIVDGVLLGLRRRDERGG